MRTLGPVPAGVIDSRSYIPRFGSYRGSLDRVDYDRFEIGRLQRGLRSKRWFYFGAATGDLYVATAVVDLGYASNTFAYVFDRQSGRNLVSASVLGPPFAASVTNMLDASQLATFKRGATRVAMTRRHPHTITLSAHYRDLEIQLSFDLNHAPPGIVAIAPLPGRLVNTTQKRTLLPVSGHVVARGKRYSMDGAFGGYDYTNGLLERHTAWKWAFFLGRTRDGQPVAMNLVEGFVGESECAVWTDKEVFGVGEGRIRFDPNATMQPWQVRTADDTVELRFDPRDVHSERKNLRVVRSNFIQAVGTYSGSIRLPDRAPLEISDVLGVAEDQDVHW